jgi:hypothetical protein
LQSGKAVNLNDGRTVDAMSRPADTHAAGTPGGGSAVGGLAGTNIGRGDPRGANLENAMGSSNFDVAIDADEGNQAYSGPAGGAVGGTPANKRSRGGKRKNGNA